MQRRADCITLRPPLTLCVARNQPTVVVSYLDCSVQRTSNGFSPVAARAFSVRLQHRCCICRFRIDRSLLLSHRSSFTQYSPVRRQRPRHHLQNRCASILENVSQSAVRTVAAKCSTIVAGATMVSTATEWPIHAKTKPGKQHLPGILANCSAKKL